jgi:hypothetical protein
MAGAFAAEAAAQSVADFAGVARTQASCCGLLLNLVASGKKAVMKRIALEGGVAAIVSSMKNHPDHKKAQLWRCAALNF